MPTVREASEYRALIAGFPGMSPWKDGPGPIAVGLAVQTQELCFSGPTIFFVCLQVVDTNPLNSKSRFLEESPGMRLHEAGRVVYTLT